MNRDTLKLLRLQDFILKLHCEIRKLKALSDYEEQRNLRCGLNVRMPTEIKIKEDSKRVLYWYI